MKITRELLRKWGACYNDERIAELVPEAGLTPLEVAALDIPAGDRLWVLLREDIIPARELRLLACGWAETVCQKTGWNDKRSLNAIAVARRFAVGEVSAAELNAAARAAWPVARSAWSASRSASRAAWAAASAALASAAEAAARSAAEAAAEAAWSASRAAWAAASAALASAAEAAAWPVARSAWSASRSASRAASRAAWSASRSAAEAAAEAAARSDQLADVVKTLKK